MTEPASGAFKAFGELKYYVDELIRQRDLWQQRYLKAVEERDIARGQRDEARCRSSGMSP